MVVVGGWFGVRSCIKEKGPVPRIEIGTAIGTHCGIFNYVSSVFEEHPIFIIRSGI
jgi:hypothetical protein